MKLVPLIGWLLAAFGLYLVVTSARAQTVVSFTGPASAKAGTSIVLTLNAVNAGAPNTGVAILQWQFGLPGGATSARPIAIPGDKTVACNAANALCILSGMNSTAIPNGPVASATVKIPANVFGNIAFWPTAVVGATPGGSASATPGGSAAALAIGPVYILNVPKKHWWQ